MNKPTILLVDDEASVRESTEQSLQLADLNVKIFSSAKEALTKIRIRE